MSTVAITGLSTEHAPNPLATDEPRPRLSWILRATTGNAAQSAYQIQADPDPDRLTGGIPSWDTGKVLSSNTLDIPYDGPLQPRTRYHWRVRVWDAHDAPTPWTALSWWETGHLGQPWSAQWIGPSAPAAPPVLDGLSWIGGPGWTVASAPVGSRWFRAGLAVGEVRAATLIATADDGLSVFLNGREVLSAKAPGNSWQAAHLLDVTEAARAAGERLVVAVEAVNRGGPAGLLLRLIVELADGGTRELRTAGHWRATGTHQPGWSDRTFDDATWPAATVLAGHGQGPWSREVVVPAPPRPAPLLRKDFQLAQPVTRARLHLSGLAYCEAHLNGHRVGDAVLDPGFTGYHRTVLYTTHDITTQLRQGGNRLDVVLGRGFLGMTTINVWNWHLADWHSEPKLLAQLDIDHPDGTRTTLGTDPSWQLADSPTRSDSLYAGESHDARHHPESWTPAHLVPAPAGTLRAQSHEPIRVTETIQPTAITEQRPGVHVVDMGRTMAGWTQITVQAPPGTRFSLQHGEKLHPDGSVQWFNEHVKDTRQQRDEHTTAGTGPETWEPRFSYKGFRYVEITGPRPLDVRGRLVHSDVAEISEFRCSEPMFEQLDRMMRRTVLNNLHGLPTDTPTYEKNGWTGDAQVGAPSMAQAFGVHRLFAKWLGDLADAQIPTGQIPVIVPNGGHWGYEQLAPTPEWTTVFPYLARELHRWYGDLQVAATHWPALTRYLDWEISRLREDLAHTALGDYLPPDAPWGTAPEDNRLTATAYLHRALLAAAELADLLSHQPAADRYRATAATLKDALNRTFLRDGHYSSPEDRGYRQTSNAIPLAFGLVPPESVQSVVDSLVADIRGRGHHLNTGCLGTSVLLPVLTTHGHPELAHALATQRSEPSWGYWIDQGADTMWEMWHRDSRSRNHYFQGTVTQWLYEHVAGLRPVANGYQRLLIRPDARAGVDWARYHVETVRGRAGVRWSRAPGGLTLTATVPVGATAEIHVPADHTVTAPAGVTALTAVPGYAVFEAGAGSWTFSTGWTAGASRPARL